MVHVKYQSALHEIGNLVALMKQSSAILLSSTRGEIDRPAIDHHAGLLSTNVMACEFWLMLAETGGVLSENTRPVSINFHNEFTRCVAAFKKTAKIESVSLQLSYRARPITFIETHPSSNLIPYILIDNAVKYAASGTTAEIILDQSDDGLTILCKNIGPLIEEFEIAQILSNGGRGLGAQRTGERGSGLGLLLLRNNTKISKGDLKAKCESLGIVINGVDQGRFEVSVHLPDLARRS